MARSYLYAGRELNSLTPQERQLERLYDQLDRPGNRLTSTQFYQTPEAAALLDQLYGAVGDRIPPGSQIVSQTPGKVTYRDPEGFEHNIIRKPDGQFSETTNRPAIIPTKANEAQQSFAQQLQQRLEGSLNQPVQFAELDPQTQAALQAISEAEQAAIDQQLGDLEGQLLARLFGQGVNRSSIATNAGARFAQQGGIVRQQQRADAANRELNLRNLITTLNQQQRGNEQNLLAGLYSNLTGQGTQREIAGAGLDLDLKKLQEATRQFDSSNYLEQLRTQIEQQKVDTANSGFNKFLGVLNAGAQLAGGVAGGLGAYRALTGGRG